MGIWLGTGKRRRRGVGLAGVVTVVALTAAACGGPGSVAGLKQFSLKTKNSEPVRITSGPDGHMWFTEFTSGRIATVTGTGAIR